MRFLSSIFPIVALVSAAMGAENPITAPDASTPMTVGKPFTIMWTPTTSGTITLTLRQGSPGSLVDVEPIVSGTPNSGTFTWTPETSLPAGSDYAIMITDEQGNMNYTPLVTISDTTVSSMSSSTAEPSSTKPSPSKATDSSSSTTMESSTITPMAGYGNSTTMVTSMTGTMSSNATYMTGMYGNSTRSSSATASGHSSASSTSASTTSPSTTAISTGAAAGLLKSPLALVVCLIGAVVYLN